MSTAKKRIIHVQRTARYFSLNVLTERTENVWIVFHGYGQLAEYFVRHFEGLNAERNLIIAPEGLSRFYVEGLTGRVGASWMTKEDREDEIHDQSAFINTALKDAGVDPIAGNYRLIVLGFSQGTATAVRWFVNNNIRPDQLVLWAGSFPHDVDTALHQNIFGELPAHFVYGNEDPFLQHLNVKEKIDEFDGRGMKLIAWPFEGKHTMDKQTLQKIVDSFVDEKS